MMIEGTVLEADNLVQMPGIRHGFFTREGGVSTGLYTSLNCGLGSDDDRESVLENRRRVAAHLAASHTTVQTVHQVHSAEGRHHR